MSASCGAGDRAGLRDRRALVAIDLGAESCRVSLLRWLPDGPAIRLVYRFPNAPVECDGSLRWPMAQILDELNAGLRRCAEIAIEGVRSIAVDGWAVDYVRLDEAGLAIEEPFCYRDRRTFAAEKIAHERISGARMRQLTGVQLSRINTAYQLVAERAHLRPRSWLGLPEYVLHRLGGDAVAERTNASHSQLMGLDGRWSEEIFAALGIDVVQAPTLVAAGTDVGRLRGPLTELAAFAETRLIAPACHDTASAIAGIADAGDDWAYISSGTWSLVGALLDGPVDTDQACEANFTNLAAADGRTCFHKNVNGLWMLRQCMDAWATEGAEFTVAEVVKAAESIPEAGHVLDVDDPEMMLQGGMPERINAQLRRRGLCELDPSITGAAEMAALIFHSLAARYAEVLRAVERMSERQLRHLYVVGGGSKNELLNRLTEEATGLSIKGTCAESSTLGNFAIQLAALEGNGGELTTDRIGWWAARLGTAMK